jgi:hypothetical protein
MVFRWLRLFSVALTVSGLLALAGAASAAAGIRFAAPGGTGANPCNDSGHPCSIFTAAADGQGVKSGDEVILAPGNYSDTAGDLGSAAGTVRLKEGISLHGEAGQPRPVITLARPQGQVAAAFIVSPNDTVSHLEIDTATALVDISIQGGIVEDLIARSSASGAHTCIQFAGLLRDSACLNTGSGGFALGLDGDSTGSPSIALTLRNVTAVATGAGSAGLSFKFSGVNGQPSVAVIGKGVIARGAAGDVVAEGLSVNPQMPGTGAKVTVALSESDYKKIKTNTDGGGGSALVSPTGPATTNIEDEPLLDADGFHELAASPTVGKVTADSTSGATDIDGQPRTVGLFADIGADEFANSTATGVRCAPVALQVGDEATCTATVTDVSAGPVIPTGSVEFKSNGDGNFSGGGVCDLASAPDGKALCHLSYTPTEIDSGNHEITANYIGDEIHPQSQGHATVRLVGSIRFAAPGGMGTDPCNEVDNPCSLFTAADETQGAEPGDEVVLTPGSYSDAAGDLGPDKSVLFKEGISVHGEAGQPRPVITLTSPASSGLLASEDTVSHIEIDTAVAAESIEAVGGTVEDVISRSSTAGGASCRAFGGTIRDSVCLSSGSKSDALAVTLQQGSTGGTEALRNVTAVATGSESTGLELTAVAPGASIPGPTFTVSASGVMARGTEHDVLARSLSSGAPGSGPNMNAVFDHSDYASTATETDQGLGTAAITHAGTRTNIEATPLLAADGFHELPGSPTVNAGATDELSGETDIDGQPRTLDGAADIGADELGQPTEATVSCLPAAVTPGAAVTCTATITDTGTEASAPAGTVRFTSDGPGRFAAAGCVLAPAATGKASCRLNYTTSAAGIRIDKVTASYPGDVRHEKSQGSTSLQIIAAPNRTAPKTTIKARPRKKTAVRRARFTFTADQSGSSFQCKLDRKPFRACRSPFTAKVRSGRHVFQVRAINPQGIADPSPAVFRWTVGKARRQRRGA